MRRGQAFEVFRLLIAAVIAGAILMVLLNVLGGLTITTQDPDDFIRQALKSMAAEGGAKSSNTIVFKSGMMVNLSAAAAAATINSDCVGAYTEDGLGWTQVDGGVLKYQGQKERGYINVICNPGSSVPSVGDSLKELVSPNCSSSSCTVCCVVVFHRAGS